jgi:transmembrane sensor
VKDDLSRRLARASAHLDAGFDDGDVERSLGKLTRRIERQKRALHAGLAVSLAALMAVGWALLRAPEQARVAQHDQPLRTLDGSLASALEADTLLQVQQDGERAVSVSLVRGAGHFAVTRRPARRYHVQAGVVDVLVLGTEFDVARRGARTRVSVVHGAVQVSWPSGQTILRAGQSDWFPRAGGALSAAGGPSLEQASAQAYAAEGTPSRATPAPATQEQTVLPGVPIPTGTGSRADEGHAASPAPEVAPSRREAWRTLARAGKHGEAFRSLDRAHVEDLEGLLLAADAARLSGHPRAAASYLERLVQRYPASAPARLGAFTLAGLWLHELHDPARAAASYARAYQLDPDGPLAQDALAREAEAYARAGQHESARRVAERYLARYPEGVRRSELQRYLGE